MNVKCLNTHVILRRSRRISDLILRSQPEAPSKGWFGRPLADFNSVLFRMTRIIFVSSLQRRLPAEVEGAGVLISNS